MEKYLSKEELSKLMKVYDVLEERSTMLLAYFGKDNIEEARKLAEIYGEAKYMLS